MNNPTCGMTTVHQSRVIGGSDAAKGAWPWQIGMYKGGYFTCGGSLISPNWVLTASHCIDAGGKADSPSGYSIVVGDLNRNVNDTTEQQYTVTKIVMHPNYDSSTINNDIALMKLSSPVIMNDHVNTVCLPNTTDAVSDGAHCYITGKCSNLASMLDWYKILGESCHSQTRVQKQRRKGSLCLFFH